LEQKKQRFVDHQLRATWMAIAKMYNEEASKYDSTMAVAFLLLQIDKEHGTASTALGPKMGMEPTSLSRLLKRMETNGLIYREKNPNDGRGVLIKLSSLGEEKRTTSKNSVQRFNETVQGEFSKKELDVFFEVTHKIRDMISEKSIFDTIKK
jgi:MarR family transcriptional regulator, organic hydroperoxide resistance regulator